MTCPTPSALANHIRYRHTEVKPFPCPRCDYRGKTLHDLKAGLIVKEAKVCPQENISVAVLRIRVYYPEPQHW